MARILLIEDDADIREGIRILLSAEGYEMLEAENGLDGLLMVNETVDLVILDVMLPGMSGIETCREIRKISYVPVLFLTAKSSEADKLIGLMAGGDDYIVKPFSYAELLGRMKAQLRRYQVYDRSSGDFPPGVENTMLQIGDIRVNEAANEVWKRGKPVQLTDLEHQILLLFMRHPGMVFSAQKLYEMVWNEPYLYTSNSTVMVHIRNLRLKIETVPDKPEHIKTVWGKGYRFE